jgi:hypothetical protein
MVRANLTKPLCSTVSRRVAALLHAQPLASPHRNGHHHGGLLGVACCTHGCRLRGVSQHSPLTGASAQLNQGCSLDRTPPPLVALHLAVEAPLHWRQRCRLRLHPVLPSPERCRLVRPSSDVHILRSRPLSQTASAAHTLLLASVLP